MLWSWENQRFAIPRAVRNVRFDVSQNLGVQRGEIGLVVGVQRGALGLVVGVQRGALGLVVGVQRGELGRRLAAAKIDHVVKADSHFVLWLLAIYIINALIYVMRLFAQLFMMQKSEPTLSWAGVVVTPRKQRVLDLLAIRMVNHSHVQAPEIPEAQEINI